MDAASCDYSRHVFLRRCGTMGAVSLVFAAEEVAVRLVVRPFLGCKCLYVQSQYMRFLSYVDTSTSRGLARA